jgi:hypothetical protein
VLQLAICDWNMMVEGRVTTTETRLQIVAVIRIIKHNSFYYSSMVILNLMSVLSALINAVILLSRRL